MIARIWHGVTPAEKADAYLDFLHRIGLADYRATPGCQAIHVLRRIEAGRAHFLLLTFWDSVEAVKQFAGDEFERAVYYPEDKDFLLEFEPFVTHYDVMPSQKPG